MVEIVKRKGKGGYECPATINGAPSSTRRAPPICKGKLAKIIKEITVAARMGGVDADGNARLRSALLSAKSGEHAQGDGRSSAIKKGTGELEGSSNLEEVTYEGYGPGGVAILLIA